MNVVRLDENCKGFCLVEFVTTIVTAGDHLAATKNIWRDEVWVVVSYSGNHAKTSTVSEARDNRHPSTNGGWGCQPPGCRKEYNVYSKMNISVVFSQRLGEILSWGK